MWSPHWFILVCKIPQLWAKATNLDSPSYFSRKYKKKYISSWTIIKSNIGPPVVAGRFLWIRVRLSIFPSFRLEVFLGLVHNFFLKLSMVLGAHVLCVTGLDYFWKIFLPQKWEKWAKNKVSWIYWKIWSLIFSEFGPKEIL